MRLLNVTKTAIVQSLAFSRDDQRLAAGCKKANVRIWDLASGQPAFNLKGMKDAEFVGFLSGPDDLIVSSWNTPATLWDLRSMTSRPVGAAASYCWDATLSRDGTRVARAERQISCLDVETGRTLWQVEGHPESGIHTRIRFDSSGARLFVIARRVAILDAATGAELGGFDLTFRKYVTLYAADVSPDGRWLAWRGWDGMQVLDTSDGRLVLEEPSVAYGYALAFTPDGAQLVAGNAGDRLVDFWDVGTWQRRSSMNPDIGPIQCLAFSADGYLAAAGGFHGKVAVWDRE
jgi:WD40 repeat protein